MNVCHYCRDVATAKAGERDVCDDCLQTYRKVIAKQLADHSEKLAALEMKNKDENKST
jgi:hypothetical protein